MTKENVVDVGNFLDYREQKRLGKSYEVYLKSLSNSQIEFEIDFILNHYVHDLMSKDFCLKRSYILDEIASRAQGVEWQTKIGALKKDISELS